MPKELPTFPKPPRLFSTCWRLSTETNVSMRPLSKTSVAGPTTFDPGTCAVAISPSKPNTYSVSVIEIAAAEVSESNKVQIVGAVSCDNPPRKVLSVFDATSSVRSVSCDLVCSLPG